MKGGKEAGWGLFLVVIIMGGIYGGVFTPTEAAVVAAVYSMFIALFVYRDMGPLKGKTWTNDEDAPHARVGFNGMVYGVSFFLVWEIMSFFAFASSETVTGGDRALWGAIISVIIAIFYVYKRSSKLEESVGACLAAGTPIWGRNLSMMLRGFSLLCLVKNLVRLCLKAQKQL